MERSINDFRLVEVLQARLATMAHRPKRARTRAALIAATALEMERSGIDGLTVERIADIAGTARGTFYLYFENRFDAALAVRRLYNAAVRRFRPRGGSGMAPFDAIVRMTRFYVRSYANNAALLRAIQFLLYTQPTYAQHRDRVNRRWSHAIVRDLNRRPEAQNHLLPNAAAVVMARSAIAMADELLREIYVHDSASLAAMREDEEHLAELLSLAWFRILYGTDPSEISRQPPP
jgi:AcrR family transcriptional regulator